MVNNNDGRVMKKIVEKFLNSTALQKTSQFLIMIVSFYNCTYRKVFLIGSLKAFSPCSFFAEWRPTGSSVVITASPVVHLIRISRVLPAFCKRRSSKQPIREPDRSPRANNISRMVLKEINSFPRVI